MKPTDALNSDFIGITNLHVSGSLSAHHQEFLAVHRHSSFIGITTLHVSGSLYSHHQESLAVHRH